MGNATLASPHLVGIHRMGFEFENVYLGPKIQNARSKTSDCPIKCKTYHLKFENMLGHSFMVNVKP